MLQQELSKRADGLAKIRQSIEEKATDSGIKYETELIELQTRWQRLSKLNNDRQERLAEALIQVCLKM